MRDSILDLFLRYRKVSIDSRSLEKGAIFFAIKGPNFDGHDYVQKALDAGASVAVVSNPEYVVNEFCILVDDVLMALQELARDFRKTLTFPVLAITGSNGKTTTKELCATVLSKGFSVHYTKGNLNNHLGVPLTILSMPEESNFLVVEMGANHRGEIRDLCQIASPTYGLITNIGKAHLEGFGGIKGVKKGKGELFDYLSAHSGIAFVDNNDPVLQGMIPKGLEVIGYESAKFKAVSTVGNTLRIESIDGKKINTRLVGEYNVLNIATALSVAKHFGIAEDLAIAAIENYEPANRRSQTFTLGSNQIILDAYNSNPTSLRKSLESLFGRQNENLILILGDMLELGEYSKHEHEEVLTWLQNKDCKEVILVGPQFYVFKEKYPFQFYQTTSEAGQNFDIKRKQNSILFFKGSRGIGVDRLLNM